MKKEKFEFITIDQLKKEGRFHDFSKDEKEWLTELGAKMGQATPFVQAIRYKHERLDDGTSKVVPIPKKNKSAYQAYIYCAVYALYESRGKKLLLDNEGFYRVMPKSVYDSDPDAFKKNFYDTYITEGVVDNIMSYVIDRWDTPKVDDFLVASVLEKLERQKLVVWCDPAWRCVQLTAKKIEAGELERVSLNEVYKDLSQGIELDDAEPYRWKALTYIVTAPVALRVRENEAADLVEGHETFQAMPILRGDQAVGKTTLVEKMGMGWGATIRNIQQQGQEQIYLRAGFWCLENAELAGVAKADVNALKEAITTAVSTFNPKYANGLKRLQNRALIIGTTNATEILKDYTGERRFWPMELPEYDRPKLDYDYFARAYATQYLELKKKLLENAKRHPTDEKARKAGAQQLLSLELEETAEDRTYKREHYSQPDPAEGVVKQFLVDLIMGASATPKKGDPYLGIVQSRDGNFKLAFGSQSILSNTFSSWLEATHPNARVYSGKANQLIESLSPTTKTIKRQGLAVKARQLDLEVVADALNLKIDSILEQSDQSNLTSKRVFN